MSNVTAQPIFETHTDDCQRKTIAYLGLGANLGNREASIFAALRELDATPKIEVTRVSSLYETSPIGVTNQPDFVNAVCEIATTLEPAELLDTVLHLENKMGRMRTQRWGPRVIDIDILLYGEQKVKQPGLTIPHPELRAREFVLIPLAEIAPHAQIPGLNGDAKKICEIVKNTGNNFVKKIVVTKQGDFQPRAETRNAAR